jgi:nicotinate-nucleotide adenylyltransferase
LLQGLSPSSAPAACAPGSAGAETDRAGGRAGEGPDGRGAGETLAVFGGSFDPPHLGHTLAALYVLAVHPVQRMLVIPTFRHPFDKPLASFDHRVRMCELAMADVKRVEVSRIEQEMGGESLTVRTLQELARRMPGVGLRLVMGSDLLEETSRWHSFERIAEIAPPIVLHRGGFPYPEASDLALPRLSSSEVRQRIRDGQLLSGWLPDAVAGYVERYGLYAASR